MAKTASLFALAHLRLLVEDDIFQAFLEEPFCSIANLI